MEPDTRVAPLGACAGMLRVEGRYVSGVFEVDLMGCKRGAHGVCVFFCEANQLPYASQSERQRETD